MKQILTTTILCIVFVTTLLSGCGKDTDNTSTVTPLPVADANPEITNPQGSFYTSNGELKAEGGLVTLGSDFMRIMVEGNEVEFALSERAQKEISIYNKDEKNLQIMQGTMLLVTYTERDLIKIAETIDILIAN